MNERKLRRFCTAMILFAMLTRLLGGVGAGRFAFSEDSAEAETRVWPVRLLAAKDGTVIAAGFAGKAKTVAQFVSILYMLAALEVSSWQHSILSSLALPDAFFTALLAIGYGLIWVSVTLTVISGIQYVWTYRKYLTA